MIAEVEEDLDLSTLFEEVIPCYAEECETEAAWRLTLRGCCYSRNYTYLLCDEHKERLCHPYREWECITCGGVKMFGGMEVVSLKRL